MRTRVALLTALAILAFAGNSLLCRAALKGTSIDAATFTTVRMVSGAVTLWLIVQVRGGDRRLEGSWLSAFWLVAYAVAFSFAYITLTAATGALLLFGAVQATMIVAGFARGERFRPLQWLGFGVAVAGLAALMLPGAAAPNTRSHSRHPMPARRTAPRRARRSHRRWHRATAAATALPPAVPRAGSCRR